MASEIKKSAKKTTNAQFQRLTNLMQEFPHLATGTPAFGNNRANLEQTWDYVALKVNSLGPPERSGCEWKKVWQDQKCRLKKKIGENNKSLHGTGGGPCSVSNLTALEMDVDRICHLSSAAAPSGSVFGVTKANRKLQFSSSSTIVLDVTPPRSHNRLAIVTPTKSGSPKNNRVPETNTPNILPPQPITSTPTPSQPNKKTISTKQKRKRNINDGEKNQQFELLQNQLEVQEKTLSALNLQAETAKAQAEAAKEQAEAAKEQAAALKEIASSTTVMAQAMVDIVRHLKDEDL